METVWHNLRKKPKPYEYVLVETYTKRYPYRVCFYFKMVIGGMLTKHRIFTQSHVRYKTKEKTTLGLKGGLILTTLNNNAYGI